MRRQRRGSKEGIDADDFLKEGCHGAKSVPEDGGLDRERIRVFWTVRARPTHVVQG